MIVNINPTDLQPTVDFQRALGPEDHSMSLSQMPTQVLQFTRLGFMSGNENCISLINFNKALFKHNENAYYDEIQNSKMI